MAQASVEPGPKSVSQQYKSLHSEFAAGEDWGGGAGEVDGQDGKESLFTCHTLLVCGNW